MNSVEVVGELYKDIPKEVQVLIAWDILCNCGEVIDLVKLEELLRDAIAKGEELEPLVKWEE